MMPRIALALTILLPAGLGGCMRLVEWLPYMDAAPYQDPPGGFSSTYHRALYPAAPRGILVGDRVDGINSAAPGSPSALVQPTPERLARWKSQPLAHATAEAPRTAHRRAQVAADDPRFPSGLGGAPPIAPRTSRR